MESINLILFTTVSLAPRREVGIKNWVSICWKEGKERKEGYRSSHNISHIVLEIKKGVDISSTSLEKHESPINCKLLSCSSDQLPNSFMHNMSLLACQHPISGTAETWEQSIRQGKLEPLHILPHLSTWSCCYIGSSLSYRSAEAPESQWKETCKCSWCQVYSFTHFSPPLKKDPGNKLMMEEMELEGLHDTSHPSLGEYSLLLSGQKEEPTSVSWVLQFPNCSRVLL